MSRRALLGAATIGAALMIAGSDASAQTDEPGDSGTATIVELGTGRPITEGDSLTTFTLDLPDLASCPGDSRNDGYRYHSFLVPVGTDVGELTYDADRPVGDDRYLPLRTPRNNLFVHELLAPNSQAGLPGLIPLDFPLTFGGWPAPGLPPGSYSVGIACTEPTAWAVDKFWDTDRPVILETDPNGENGEVLWRLEGADPAAVSAQGDDGGGGSTWILLAAVAAAGLGGGVFFLSRRNAASSNRTERQPT